MHAVPHEGRMFCFGILILLYLKKVAPAASCKLDRPQLHASTAAPCMAAAADWARSATARDARAARRRATASR